MSDFSMELYTEMSSGKGKELQEIFLDAWWDVDPNSYKRYHKTRYGKRTQMISGFLARIKLLKNGTQILDKIMETSIEKWGKETPYTGKLSGPKKVIKKKKASSWTILEDHRNLDIRNLEQLPRGTGARYLEIMESHNPNELSRLGNAVYIAVKWRRVIPKKGSGILVESKIPQ